MRLKLAFVVLGFGAGICVSFAQQGESGAQDANELLTGPAAFGDWTKDRPGLRRKLTTADLPAPYATRPAANGPSLARAPQGAKPKVPLGFSVEPFVTGLSAPRLMRRAPNGDIFVAESDAGRVRVIRAADGAAKPEKVEVFARGLDEPFGIAFYPPGPDPKWVYVAETDGVVRFPYASGDLSARGEPQAMVDRPADRGTYARATFSSPPMAGKCMSRSVRARMTRTAWVGSLRRRRSSPTMRSAPPGAAKKIAPTCWSSIRKAVRAISSRRDCAIASGSPCIRKPRICGARRMSATDSATTCLPTM